MAQNGPQRVVGAADSRFNIRWLLRAIAKMRLAALLSALTAMAPWVTARVKVVVASVTQLAGEYVERLGPCWPPSRVLD